MSPFCKHLLNFKNMLMSFNILKCPQSPNISSEFPKSSHFARMLIDLLQDIPLLFLLSSCKAFFPCVTVLLSISFLPLLLRSLIVYAPPLLSDRIGHYLISINAPPQISLSSSNYAAEYVPGSRGSFFLQLQVNY